MATHLLTLKGNYIWLDDLDTGKRYEGLAKEVLIRSDLDDSTIFYFDGLNQFDKNIGIAFGDIDVNGNGAFVTLAEWQDWYTANTGNFNGGGSAPKYKVLSFIVNQSGTNPPVLTELENTIGEVSTTYVNGGNYLISSSGMFTANKTTPISIGIFDDGLGLPRYVTGKRISDNQYQLWSFDESWGLFDGVLNNLFLEIRVYE